MMPQWHWPFGYKMSSAHHFILLNICMKFCQNWCMNFWLFWPLISVHQHVIRSSCCKFKDIPSRCSRPCLLLVWRHNKRRRSWSDRNGSGHSWEAPHMAAMTGGLTKIHSPPEISSKPLRGPPPLLAILCLHPTADLPAVQTTTKPEVLHQEEKRYSFHSLCPNLSWLPHRPHQWRSMEGRGNSLSRSPRRVCWYYWQTVWLCLSECDDRTKHWYLPCDNRHVWTGSVEKRGVWDWQSVCVLRLDAPYL